MVGKFSDCVLPATQIRPALSSDRLATAVLQLPPTSAKKVAGELLSPSFVTKPSAPHLYCVEAAPAVGKSAAFVYPAK